MPEGPEIRQAADQVEKALKDRTVLDLHFAFSHLQDYEDLLKGQKVTHVDTKGKAMLIQFSNDYTIYSHNQLYGKWYVRNAYNYPKTNRQLRLAIHNEKKSALLYSASDIEVLRHDEVEHHPFIAKIGPDLLSEPITANELVKCFESDRFRRRRWTALLLNQAFIAGIGNYLRSEILFTAGIHPDLRPMDCTPFQLEKAAKASLDLMWRSYQHKGVTNDLQLAERLKAQGAKRYQYRHWVFNREGDPCRICGTEIVKFRASSRRCYYCPHCQSKEE
ncbi:endonuclease 8 [Halobacillus andaensis]|uniref:Formamidopyrimidine-DNA glycosylase n=1 Tax=Halobacillus andaensis TaxID=1176239 RepID=A0A917EWQ8_HALAA|nr:endonuclease VIII [Halobacillus andaensis]MBP2004990.1 endonuclease-8 [Halobacillus andaensis]GGF17373.1 endonuclease 8 [Halobacillus andaensis]